MRCRLALTALGIGAAAFTYYVAALPPLWSETRALPQYVANYAIVLGIFLWGFDCREARTIRYLSEATYPMYLYHFFLVAELRILLPPSQGRNLLSFAVAVTGSLLLVYFGRLALGRYARYVIG